MIAGSIHVLRPGLQTTVQDLGRWGFQAQGVPVAGPMDPFSHRLANALVGNARTAATLEVALVGPEIEFDDERVVAVTGAEFAVTFDTGVVPHAQAFVVPSGARLHFGMRRRGARAYLAVDGGFDAPILFGSRSTHVSSRMGGWAGRAMVRGDRLPLGPPSGRRPRLPRQNVQLHDVLASSPVLRVLPGPERDRFDDDALEALQSGPYAIDGESDRMGFRLSGPRLHHTRGADIISDATPLGSLQVPGSGQPILLMADRQTTGGYPKVATVITADIGIAGQAAPGDDLLFKICTPANALSALIANERRLLAVEATRS
jgi:antagonist of KipI